MAVTAWFVAKDVCDVLDIGNSRMATTRLDADEIATVSLTDTDGRPHQNSIVSEAGVYELILASRKPQAKAFKRWLKHELLPTMRGV